MEIRPEVIAHYTGKYGDGVHTQLLESEDGTWLDIWSWGSRADAEHELANMESVPIFMEWVSLVERVGFEWAKPRA